MYISTIQYLVHKHSAIPYKRRQPDGIMTFLPQTNNYHNSRIDSFTSNHRTLLFYFISTPTMEGSATSNPNPQPPVVLLGKKARMRGPNNNKPKITKEERRLKYTAKARDRREAAQARSRDRDLTCYRCRKSGHSAENCKHAPAADAANTAVDDGGGGGEGGGGKGGATSGSIFATPTPGRKRKKGGNICYKCGSTEHRIQLCPRIKPFLKRGNGSRIDYGKIGDLPFAECYVCNRTGHLASHCPSSDKGLYPRGGACRVCGSVDHLAADCPKERAVASVFAIHLVHEVEFSVHDTLL